MPTADAEPARGPVPVVPGYVLEELLGRGGTGQVWRARPRVGGPSVAVKVLVRGEPERQVREAGLLAELDHPHLVRLHQVVRRRTPSGDQVALVLDLLGGGSLAALLAARGRLRPGEVVTAIAPVAAALAHVHERGIVHGDVSPGNVVFTDEGRPVLTDLGVARVIGEQGSDEVTPPYVDPVVARGGAAGPASDVFGVAAAAFHALTGIPPWNAAGAGDTLVVAASGEIPDLALLAPEAPADLVAVVERGLSPYPHLRGSAAAFALDLRHACPPERVALPAPGTDPAVLGRTGQAPRTELTHQVRRPPRAHAAPTAPGRWARVLAHRPVPAPGVVRRAAAVLAVAAALLGSAWLGVRWGSAEDATVPAARTAPAVTATSTAKTTSAEPAVATATELTTTEGASTEQPSTAQSSPGVPSTGVLGTAEEPTSADPAGVPVTAAAWRDLLADLYSRRADAFTRADAAVLDDVFAPGSALLATDAARVDELRATGQQLVGFAPEVVEVASTTPVDGGFRVQLTERVPPYQVLDGAGGRTEVPAQSDRPVEMTLVSSSGGWLIATAELVP